MNDQDKLLRAISSIQTLISEWVNPQPRDPIATVDKIMMIVCAEDMIELTDRLRGAPPPSGKLRIVR